MVELKGCGKELKAFETWYTLVRDASKIYDFTPAHKTVEGHWFCGVEKHSQHHPWICERCARKMGLIW